MAAAATTFAVNSFAYADQPTPLRHAHAHNDYYHTRPLFDALDQGFGSVEADIFLVGDQLLVGHYQIELSSKRSLESLYLEPLKQRIETNGGSVYEKPGRFVLLVDVKTDGEKTYAVLEKVLAKYDDILSVTQDGKHEAKAVTVIISGNRAKQEIAESEPRYAGIDGRLSDLDSDAPADLLPLISDKWGSHFKWKGEGEMPADQKAKLREIVKKAHAKGRIVRFWATPEHPKVWSELNDAGVDLIGTDMLERLADFLNDKPLDSN
ncbi:hypothetical protein C5Y93_01930 [Blastopirellula marina]|uniref:Altered inheritance of mitochondria protein 6 n=1 Tax=Blastopirellula marina TaxID=124 RepID=A0A2S8GU10_9BACT|nr:hypothetical protein C5Y93_01930 [Blastopirellula marina]